MSRKTRRQQAKNRRRQERKYLRDHENEQPPTEPRLYESPNSNSGFIPRKVTGRSENQVEYIRRILQNDITLCHGPAGSGKTHIAVGMASRALREKQIERIILTRPAIDSGASIGFLPGTLEDKMAAYLQPLFDELGYFIDRKYVKAWMEHRIIEIAPLTYMRGRTFINSYVILDEAQNATLSELKMLLTRIGLNSKMILVGDLFQSDLPSAVRGGFARCIDDLRDLDGVGVCSLTKGDIVRHPLIAGIEERLSRKEAA